MGHSQHTTAIQATSSFEQASRPHTQTPELHLVTPESHPVEATAGQIGATALSNVAPLAKPQLTWLGKVLEPSDVDRIVALSDEDRHIFARRLRVSYEAAHVQGQTDKVKQERASQMELMLLGASPKEIADHYGIRHRTAYTSVQVRLAQTIGNLFSKEAIATLIPDDANNGQETEQIIARVTEQKTKTSPKQSSAGSRRPNTKKPFELSDHVLVKLDKPFVDYKKAHTLLPELFSEDSTGIWKYDEETHRPLLSDMVHAFSDDETAKRRINDQFQSSEKRAGKQPVLTGDPYDDLLEQSNMYRVPKYWETCLLFTKLRQGQVAYNILSHHMVDLERQASLKATAREGAYAYRAIYQTNIRLAARPAYKASVVCPTLQKSDHLIAGLMGLRKGIEKYDENRGFAFSTYAMNWIKQEIGRNIHNFSRIVRVPVHSNEQINSIRTAEQELTAQLNRQPSPQEVSEVTGIAPETTEILMRFGSFHTPSLNAKIGEMQDDEFGDFIPSTDVVEEALLSMSSKHEIKRYIEAVNLSPDELLAISIRHGYQVDSLQGKIFYGKAYEDIFDEMGAKDDPGNLALLARVAGKTKKYWLNTESSAIDKLHAAAAGFYDE